VVDRSAPEDGDLGLGLYTRIGLLRPRASYFLRRKSVKGEAPSVSARPVARDVDDGSWLHGASPRRDSQRYGDITRCELVVEPVASCSRAGLLLEQRKLEGYLENLHKMTSRQPLDQSLHLVPV
jgi:hypothetical protein